MPFNTRTLQLLNAAIEKRKSLRKITNALRLINGSGDSLEGLVLEQYDRHFVAQVFGASWLKEAEALKAFLLENFSVDYFLIKNRVQNASSLPEKIPVKVLIENAPSKTIIRENGLNFEVDLNDTLNTGLFLDMRANRNLVGQSCKNKRVLNCFSYTCSFGVYAKAQGAWEVINVDVSRKILDKGQRNYQLNGLAGDASNFVRADAVAYLERAIKKDNRFDVIILDPPSFSRAGDKIFSVAKHLAVLIETASAILNAKGQILVATNFSGLDHRQLEQMVRKSSCQSPKKLTKLGQDKDFPGSGQSKESHLAALWVEY